MSDSMKGTTRYLAACALAGLLTLSPTDARAQDAVIGAVGDLLKNVTDINISFIPLGRFGRSAGQGDERHYGGFGVEMTYTLAEFQFSVPKYCEDLSKSPVSRTDTSAGYKRFLRTCPQKSEDSTLTQVVKKEGNGASVTENTYAVNKTKTAGKKNRITLELGFSYDQINRVRLTDPDIHASLRDFPAISLYAEWNSTMPYIYPYLGVRSGIMSIVGGRAYSRDTLYTLSAQTFIGGAVLGLESKGDFPARVFTELGYTRRKFPSAEWGLPKDGLTVPAKFPRQFDFSGVDVSLGVTFHLPKGGS